MSCTLVDLEMAEDLVRLGERQVARQREIIARLKAGGHSVEMAEELLAEFEAALRSQLVERDQMRSDVEPAP